MTEITRYRVRFAGPRAATGPFTWGQLEMWAEAQISQAGVPSFANVLGGGPLPPGLKIDQVLAAFGTLLERHESLRTRFRTGPDGQPVQEVVRAGEVELEVAEIAPDEDIFEVVGGWWPDMEGRPYDLAGGLPIRVRIGAVSGEPVLVMFGMSHMACDFMGTRVLFDELLCLLDGREPASPPGIQPIELAELERSETGRRVLGRSLGHWRRELSAAPPTMFPAPAGVPEEPRYWRAELHSQTAARALERAAARCGVGTSSVLLAVMAVLVGRYTGLDRCSVRMVAGNRGRPELRRAVANVSQEVPAVVDLGSSTFGEVAEAARTASLHAQRNARYDPSPAGDLIAEHGVDLNVCFNDMWTPVRGGQGVGELTSRPAASVFQWEEKTDRASVVFLLEAFEVLDDPDAVRLSLFADTAHVPPPLIRAFLYAIEDLLVTLAERDVRLDEIAVVS